MAMPMQMESHFCFFLGLNFASHLCKLSAVGAGKTGPQNAKLGNGEVLSVIDQFPPSSQTGSYRIGSYRSAPRSEKLADPQVAPIGFDWIM